MPVANILSERRGKINGENRVGGAPGDILVGLLSGVSTSLSKIFTVSSPLLPVKAQNQSALACGTAVAFCSQQQHKGVQMKRFVVIGALAAVVTVVSAGSGMAWHPGPSHGRDGNSIERRIDRQEWRIRDGVSSGDLNRHEARMLRRNLDHIKASEAAFRSDGHLNHSERVRLEQMLDKNSRKIEHARRNAHYKH